MRDAKYEEIADHLLDEICRGKYPNGKLSSMSVIAKQFKVNLQTANRAVKLLEQQGVVHCHAGKTGTLIDPLRATLVANCSGSRQSNLMFPDHVFGWKHRIKLRFLHCYQNERMQDLFQQISAAFTRRYPWVEIDPVAVDSELRILSGEMPFDVALLIGRNMNLMNRQGRLSPITEFVQRDPAFRCEDFCPGVWSFCSRNDAVYGIPFSWNVPLLYAPAPFSRWEDLTENTSPERPGILSLGWYSLFLMFLGELPPEDDLRKKLPQLRRLVRLLKQLSTGPDGRRAFWDSMAEIKQFHPDRNSFLCGYYSCINSARVRAAGWSYHLLPELSGTRIFVTECLAASRTTRNLPESLLWMKFLIGTEAQRKFMSNPNFLSVRRSLIDQMPSEFAGLLRKACENAVQPEMSSPALFRFYSSAYPLLKRYFDNELPEDVLLAEISELLRENRLLDSFLEDPEVRS